MVVEMSMVEKVMVEMIKWQFQASGDHCSEPSWSIAGDGGGDDAGDCSGGDRDELVIVEMVW